jgi:acyl-CoA reductase-like NAD-dependent aldehyde dehydrogenase
MYQGHICMSTERIVVDQSVAEEFATKLGKKAQTLLAGNPRDSKMALGPLIVRYAAAKPPFAGVAAHQSLQATH